jgi:hypothetical protein
LVNEGTRSRFREGGSLKGSPLLRKQAVALAKEARRKRG